MVSVGFICEGVGLRESLTNNLLIAVCKRSAGVIPNFSEPSNPPPSMLTGDFCTDVSDEHNDTNTHNFLTSQNGRLNMQDSKHGLTNSKSAHKLWSFDSQILTYVLVTKTDIHM